MLTTPRAYVAAMAACLVITILPGAADARGGAHGVMGSRMGIATSHTSAPRMLMPLTTAPGGKQTGPQPPSQAAAAAAAATQSTSIPTTAPPPSVVAAPAAQAPTIAPLSPSPAQTIESSGGPARTDLTASSTASSASPSESAPSAPGGGGDTLQACMGFWDPGTHMSKVEWRAACTRTLHRLDLRTPVP
jgi:hypothetical protein